MIKGYFSAVSHLLIHLFSIIMKRNTKTGDDLLNAFSQKIYLELPAPGQGDINPIESVGPIHFNHLPKRASIYDAFGRPALSRAPVTDL